MKLNNKLRFAAVGVVSLALVAGASMVASATTQTNGSFGPLYVADTNGAIVTDPAVVWGWATDNTASGSETDFAVPLLCPVESTGTYTFIATPGTENTSSAWKASAPTAFETGTKGVAYADLKPYNQLDGAAAAVKTAGGKYSLGVACTIDNGVNVVRTYFRTINVTAVTGDYTIEPTINVPPTDTGTPVPTSGTIALAPQVIPAVIVNAGPLSLSVPTGATATFAAPSLIDNVSTTTGTLGAVTVNDLRNATRQGWDLSADVADFKNTSDITDIITKSHLGFAPSVTALLTKATGVTAGAAQIAGSATYPAAFASGAAAKTTGASVLDAGLTFVAPQDKGAATYSSTMTITVTSK